MKNQYKIIGRYMDGSKVSGYYLIDRQGEGKPFTKEHVNKLALHGEIENCSAQQYRGEIILKGKGVKLRELPVVEIDKGEGLTAPTKQFEEKNLKYIIAGRIKNNKYVIGYILTHPITGETKNISKEQILALAKIGKIQNARVQQSNGKEILRGVSCDLASLPSYVINN